MTTETVDGRVRLYLWLWRAESLRRIRAIVLERAGQPAPLNHHWLP